MKSSGFYSEQILPRISHRKKKGIEEILYFFSQESNSIMFSNLIFYP